MSSVTIEELSEICKLTVELTKLRQNECKHLCVENFAPPLFASLLGRLSMHKQGLISLEGAGMGKDLA